MLGWIPITQNYPAVTVKSRLHFSGMPLYNNGPFIIKLRKPQTNQNKKREFPKTLSLQHFPSKGNVRRAAQRSSLHESLCVMPGFVELQGRYSGPVQAQFKYRTFFWELQGRKVLCRALVLCMALLCHKIPVNVLHKRTGQTSGKKYY